MQRLGGEEICLLISRGRCCPQTPPGRRAAGVWAPGKISPPPPPTGGPQAPAFPPPPAAPLPLDDCDRRQAVAPPLACSLGARALGFTWAPESGEQTAAGRLEADQAAIGQRAASWRKESTVSGCEAHHQAQRWQGGGQKARVGGGLPAQLPGPPEKGSANDWPVGGAPHRPDGAPLCSPSGEQIGVGPVVPTLPGRTPPGCGKRKPLSDLRPWAGGGHGKDENQARSAAGSTLRSALGWRSWIAIQYVVPTCEWCTACCPQHRPRCPPPSLRIDDPVVRGVPIRLHAPGNPGRPGRSLTQPALAALPNVAHAFKAVGNGGKRRRKWRSKSWY